MAVDLVKVELDVLKESKEVIDVLADVIDHLVVQKKPATELVVLLPKLAVAVDGIQKISEELKDPHRSDTAAYLIKKVAPLLGV